MALIKKTTDPDRDLTILTVTGPVTADELMAALTKFYDQGPTGKLIWDFSDAELLISSVNNLSPVLEKIIAVAKSHAHFRPGGKTAVVFPDVLGFGVGRMYEILSEVEGHPITHGIFRTISEAMAWLD